MVDVYNLLNGNGVILLNQTLVPAGRNMSFWLGS
jgi:hypothetical protein